MNPESSNRIAALQPLIEGLRGTRAMRLEMVPAMYLCDDLGPAAASTREDLKLLHSVGENAVNLAELVRVLAPHVTSPVPMLLACSVCDAKHVDEGEWATRPHRTHLCHACGALFRPALVPTVGVAALADGSTSPTQFTRDLAP